MDNNGDYVPFKYWTGIIVNTQCYNSFEHHWQMVCSKYNAVQKWSLIWFNDGVHIPSPLAIKMVSTIQPS